MSDKEVEKLFKQRFDQFESEPSADIWNKIESKIERKDSKKPYAIFWKSAASIAVILGVGLLFYKDKPTLKLKAKQEKQVHILKPKVNTTSLNKTSEEIFIPKTVNKAVSNTTKLEKVVKIQKPIGASVSVKEVVLNTKALSLDTQESKNALPAFEVAKEKVIDDEFKTNTLLAQNSETVEDLSENKAPKKKVKGIGGLVNFLVSKVDPRTEKLIEFKEGNEGPEISGMNLGIIKLNIKNK